MNACMKPDTAADGKVEESMSQLVPSVASLLQRITAVEPVTSHGESGIRLTSPLTFPDGIGDGAVVAELFRYRDAVRLDIQIDHNRVFALVDGRPSDRRCFFNDYRASQTLVPGTESLSSEFVRHVVAGINAAREAVRRHNKQSQAPWNEVRVAVASEKALVAG